MIDRWETAGLTNISRPEQAETRSVRVLLEEAKVQLDVSSTHH